MLAPRPSLFRLLPFTIAFVFSVSSVSLWLTSYKQAVSALDPSSVLVILGGRSVPSTLFPSAGTRRLHADRVAGGHRDHRHPNRTPAARRAEDPRSRRTLAVQQQPQADGPG